MEQNKLREKCMDTYRCNPNLAGTHKYTRILKQKYQRQNQFVKVIASILRIGTVTICICLQIFLLNLRVSVQSLVWNEVVLTTEVIFPIICVAYLLLQTELAAMISLHVIFQGADTYLFLTTNLQSLQNGIKWKK